MEHSALNKATTWLPAGRFPSPSPPLPARPCPSSMFTAPPCSTARKGFPSGPARLTPPALPDPLQRRTRQLPRLARRRPPAAHAGQAAIVSTRHTLPIGRHGSWQLRPSRTQAGPGPPCSRPGPPPSPGPAPGRLVVTARAGAGGPSRRRVPPGGRRRGRPGTSPARGVRAGAVPNASRHDHPGAEEEGQPGVRPLPPVAYQV